MKVAGIQADTAWEDPEANFAQLAPEIARSVGSGADIVLLPEMFSTGFSMAAEKIAEPEDGPTARFLIEQAVEHRIWIGGSCPVAVATAPRPFNRFMLVSPDAELIFYDKIHPFGIGGESEHYQPGSRSVTIDVHGLRCTLFVCYDLRFADWFWQVADDTDCYLVVANWPASRQAHWRTLLEARAIENQAFVVGVNRVGVGDGVSYGGGSIIVDPFGEVIAETGSSPGILLGDVDGRRVELVRAKYPFLKDR